jgi:hypothetical protein
VPEVVEGEDLQTVRLEQPLDGLYRHWLGKRHGRAMPRRADIDPLEIPGEIWPYTMLLDVVWSGATPRFRYRRVGDVFWRDAAGEPTGKFVDQVLSERAGYRDYVVGIYEEMARRRLPLYTENSFTLEGRSAPMLTRRVSLPLSNDGEAVNMVLAGHVFEYGRLARDTAFSLITGLQELTRVVLDESSVLSLQPSVAHH